jgi:hypothetical protein
MLGIPGLVLQLACNYLIRLWGGEAKTHPGSAPPEYLAWILLAGMIGGSIMLIVGLGFYAKGKGYSGVLGLLGLLSCIGLLILALLPDREK